MQFEAFLARGHLGQSVGEVGGQNVGVDCGQNVGEVGGQKVGHLVQFETT